MSETLSRVEFIASLAVRGNAIQFGSDGGSLRLDVDDKNANALVLLQTFFRNKTFKVTIEPDKQVGIGGATRNVAKGPERKSEWTTQEE